MGLFGPPNVKKLADRGNVEKLLEVVRYARSSQIRREAVNALGKIGGQETVDGLVQALKDPNYSVRDEAERVFREITDRLVPALGDSNRVVRDEAGRVFREIVARLVQAVKDSDLIEQEPKPY